MDILQKHFKKDHVHMRLWTRFYGMVFQDSELRVGYFNGICEVDIEYAAFPCFL